MPFLTFLLLCFCWGSTFIPLKEGLFTLPPLLFAGLRFVLAASVFGILLALRGRALPTGRALLRLTGAALLAIALNYGLLFWGAQFLPSGISALVNFGSVALSLTGLSLTFRLERVSWQKLAGLGFGVAGLLLLVVPKLSGDRAQFLGVAAIFSGGFCYALGSLLIRPLLKTYGALAVTTWQLTVGGVVLLAANLLFGPQVDVFAALSNPKALLSLMYLVGVGSLLGFWLYNHLLTSWKVSKLALYNFVSPVIALGLGVLVYSEVFSVTEGVASVLLLAGMLVNYLRLPGAEAFV